MAVAGVKSDWPMIGDMPSCLAAPFDARIGRGGTDWTLCRVVALSCEGARVSSYALPAVGAAIVLTAPRIGRIMATVERADADSADCRFDAPMDRAVIEALITRN